jgi:hypothetical protein
LVALTSNVRTESTMNARLATVAVERAALEQAVATLSLRLQRVVDHIAKLTVQPPAATTHREGPSAARRTASASACPSSNSASLTPARFIDIGVNLTDPMFRGEYRGKPKHRDDLDDVLGRGWATGLDAVFITGGSLSESAAALKLCELDNRLFCTVGCHPTRCTEVRACAVWDAHLSGILTRSRMIDCMQPHTFAQGLTTCLFPSTITPNRPTPSSTRTAVPHTALHSNG